MAAAEPKNEAARPVRVRLFQSRHDVVVLDLYTMAGRWYIVVVLELSKRAAAGGKGQPEGLAQEEGQKSEAVRRQQAAGRGESAHRGAAAAARRAERAEGETQGGPCRMN